MYQNAKCDITGESIPINTGSLVADTQTGEWYFCRHDVADEVPNHFRWDGASEVSDQLGLVKLLAGLSAKQWFEPERFFSKLKTFY